MNFFELNLKLGFTHILDPAAYDHLLFIVALVAVYKLSEWRKVAILVTAFTLGHSLTLALSALDIISFNQSLIEFLIPVTIILTALYNGISAWKELPTKRIVGFDYMLALAFGLIHGMAFSNQLKAMLMPGEEDHILIQLFGFNLGIELGQLVIVFCILLLSYLMLSLVKINQRWWTLGLSGIVLVFAIHLLVQLFI